MATTSGGTSLRLILKRLIDACNNVYAAEYEKHKINPAIPRPWNAALNACVGEEDNRNVF